MPENTSRSPNWEDDINYVEETPEEVVDRLIEEVETNCQAHSCSELRQASRKLSSEDSERHRRVQFALSKCDRNGY